MIIQVKGVMSPEYIKAMACARDLAKLHPERVSGYETEVFHQTQWDNYLKLLQRDKKGAFYDHKDSLIVYVNGNQYIGGCESILEWALQEFRYVDNTSNLLYKKMANNEIVKTFNKSPGRSFVYLDISIESGATQQVIIELFEKECPKTCKNFSSLCKGFTTTDKRTIGYKDSEIKRVVKGMFVQAGDINSKGVNSIFGDVFEDESFAFKHTEPGMVGMCRSKDLANTNECQFYITTGSNIAHLDNKNVVFGRVVSGLRIIKLVEKLDCVNEKPTTLVKITAAGEYVRGEK